jgi:hypothetical protein
LCAQAKKSHKKPELSGWCFNFTCKPLFQRLASRCAPSPLERADCVKTISTAGCQISKFGNCAALLATGGWSNFHRKLPNMATVHCESSSPISPAVPRSFIAFHLQEKSNVYWILRHISTMEDIPPMAMDTTLTANPESILPELLLRRQRQLASSSIQWNLLLEAAEVLVDDTFQLRHNLIKHWWEVKGR